MTEIYRDLLILICLTLIGWGVIRIERIYQYPFFMGSIFLSFIVPQAFALTNNPSTISQEALERVLLYSCLCTAACWVGYAIKPNIKWLIKLNIVVDNRKLFQGGIALMAMGYFFSFLLSRTTIQTAANGNWTGPATIYYFFSQTIYIGFPIFLLQALQNPKFANLVFTVISSVPIIQTILVGRRTQTMILITIVGFSLWLIRRYAPPRILVITAVFMMAVLIPVLGQLRSGFWNLVFSGDWQATLSAAQDAFNSLQKGDILELRNAALFMDAAEKTGLYGYGTGFWDNIVFQYVPGQIVGYDFKKSLQFNLLTPQKLQELYGYSIPNGLTYTGVGDSFMEFSYFGSLIFALLGYIFKHLWISSVYQRSICSRLLYMSLLSPAMLSVTHAVGTFLQLAIFQVFFISLVIYYSRSNHKFYYSNT